MKKKINTSSDSKYFSRAVNLIFSIRNIYAKEVEITLWDLGLNKFQLFILSWLEVNVRKVPNLCTHWRDCYTWKLIIMYQSDEEIFFHLDAGNTLLKNIDEVFEQIENCGYFFIDQGQLLEEITPMDYFDSYGLVYCKGEMVFSAGNVGFNKSKKQIINVLDFAFNQAILGKCLGYSESEINRATNKQSAIIRECQSFRHDQTILNCAARKYMNDIKILSYSNYGATALGDGVSIYNNRRRAYGSILKSDNLYIISIIPVMLAFDSIYILGDLMIKIKKRMLMLRLKLNSEG